MAIEINNIQVNHDDDGIRLDRWFKRHHPKVAFTLIAMLIRKGKIKVDGKRADINTKIAEGQSVTFPELTKFEQKETKPKKQVKTNPEDIIDQVIFMDQNLIILNKPHGLASQDGTKVTVSLDQMLEHLKFDYEDKPKLVHRLDRETSGIMVIARTAKAAAQLSELIRMRKIKKHYLAILQGMPELKSGKVNAPISKQKEDGFEKMSHDKKARPAVTEYRILDNVGDVLSLAELNLITGKTHQIRVHMQMLGCPILGDDKYNLKRNHLKDTERKLHLHSYTIEFEVFGKKYNFNADLPPHMVATMKNFGLNLPIY
jgi:23S rRNA pseudouridine955/2504/2580 synthase